MADESRSILELPSVDGNTDVFSSSTKSFILIGANGSGKTRLGIWIEQHYRDSSYRISAQRSLTISQYIEQKGLGEASSELLYGGANAEKRDNRWQYDVKLKRHVPEITELTDFNRVLSTLIAKQTLEEHEFYESCRLMAGGGGRVNDVDLPQTTFDKLKRIWNAVFPHLSIDIRDAQVIAEPNGFDSDEFHGRFMSDGEREALYLIAQVLCVPQGTMLIVDEPEIHLHCSIVEPLWAQLERERDDCMFVYITHDTQFAARHTGATKVWLQGYDGESWQYQEVSESDLPDEMLLDILGSRKKVLFVEGDSSSYDYQVFTSAYPEYYVIPCGSCEQVTERTKAMQACSSLHDKDCYGIIDRDHRRRGELESLATHGVHALPVAEIENVFVTREVIECVAEAIAPGNPGKADEVVNAVIDTVYANALDSQVNGAFVSEVRYRLTVSSLKGKTPAELSAEIARQSSEEELRAIRDEIEREYTSALERRDYPEVLRLLNDKSVLGVAAKSLGLGGKKQYMQHVIGRLANGDERMLSAVRMHLPDAVPRNGRSSEGA